MKSEMYDWIRTDTAAIMFTALQSKNSSRICRVTVTFKEHEINADILKQAVYSLVPRFPAFCRKLRKGLFWGFLEKTDAMPQVVPDNELPARMQWISRTEYGPEFRVLHGKNSISVELSHVIADGTGFMELLKAITIRYLELCGYGITDAQGIKRYDETPTATESENGFSTYHTKEKIGLDLSQRAYQYPKVFEKDYMCHVFALMNVDDIKKVCKPKSMTITEYLVAALILATVENEKEPIKNSIIINVPVNMRKFFPSDTVRNFSGNVPICYSPKGKKQVGFDEVCEHVRGQLKEKINITTLQAFINSTYSATANPFLRVIPGFIKWPGLRLIQRFEHEKTMTTLFSNIGDIKFPQSISDMIERVDMVGGDSSIYGLTKFCAAASVNGHMSVCLSMTNSDDSMFNRFVDILRNDGIPVSTEKIEGNTKYNDEYRRAKIGKLSIEKIKAFCNI